MPEFKNKRIRTLVQQLSQDPTVRAAMDKLNEKSRLGQHVKSLKEFLPLLTKLSKMGGRRAKFVGQHLALITFLFEISVLLKANVFDRPEVKQFFTENWGLLQKRVSAVYLFCSNYVRTRLKKH